mgnify:CR=1 FL=1
MRWSKCNPGNVFDSKITLNRLTVFLVKFAGIAVLMGLQACSDQSAASADNLPKNIDENKVEKEPAVAGLDEHKVLAKVNGVPVIQADIDQTIALKLYDLEWRKYELRLQALVTKIETTDQHGPGTKKQVDILIEPPMPPRLDLQTGGQPSYGDIEAPITVSVFCSYQSSHCGRMQATYQALNDRYLGQLRFVFFDFPQRFHRFGLSAGHAARCADDENKFWPYHKALWSKQDKLTEETYRILTTQLEMDEGKFETCMSEQTHQSQLTENIALSKSLGFSNVPVTLINGLYINGPKDINILRYFVDKELERMGISRSIPQKKQSITRTSLPLKLEGQVVSKQQVSVLILNTDTGQSRGFVQDDEILPKVYLVMIQDKRVVIENKGVLEYLDVSNEGANGEGQLAQDEALLMSGEIAVSKVSDDRAEEYPDTKTYDGITEHEIANAPHQEFEIRDVVKAVGETPLSKAWVSEQLQNQSQLEAHFEAAELVVEGVHIMKLQGIDQNKFYQTLGLVNGDVVLRVNNQWVHETQNNLFAELENEQQVDVVLMRNGLPKRFKYVIN